MTLSLLEGVNRILSALGEDNVGSLTSGFTPGSSRSKIFLNDAWTGLTTKQSWWWFQSTSTLQSTGTATPDLFNSSGLLSVDSLLLTYDNTAQVTTLPNSDDQTLLVGLTQLTEEALWTGSTGGITIGAVRAYAANVYTAATAGTTGTTPPTHTAGSVSDGGVTWTFTRVFSLTAYPYAFSTPSPTQVRLRPYPGPLALQRYRLQGPTAPFRLSADTDVFTGLPVEYEPALIDLALALTALKHLDDADAARMHKRNAEDTLNNLRSIHRKSLGPKRLRMVCNGIFL